jgi:hypothetical protein
MAWRELIQEKFRRRRLHYAVIALFTVGLLPVAQNEDAARHAQVTFDTLKHGLSLLDPVTAFHDVYERTYDKAVHNCHSVQECSYTPFSSCPNGSWDINCGLVCKPATKCEEFQWKNLLPHVFGPALIDSGYEMLRGLYAGLSWDGLIILAFIFALPFPFVAALYFDGRRSVGVRLAATVLVLLALPLVAGVFAFGLKWLLIGAAALAGNLIGIVLWSSAAAVLIWGCLTVLWPARGHQKLDVRSENVAPSPKQA